MLSSLKLAHDQKCGETVAILARCIAESTITLQWLCKVGTDDAFLRYLSKGLCTDMHLSKLIDRNVQDRSGKVLRIETRMQESIDRCFKEARLSEEEVRTAKRLPDLKAMCDALGYPDELYVGIQRIGSHAVHGTWPDLLFHYVKPDESGWFEVRDNIESRSHSNFFFTPSLLVVDALRRYLIFPLMDSILRTDLLTYVDEIKNIIISIDAKVRVEDFLPIEEQA